MKKDVAEYVNMCSTY